MKRALAVVLSMAFLLPMVATETFAVSDLTASKNSSMSIAEFTNTYVGDSISTEASSSVDAKDVGTAPNVVYRNISYDVTGRYYCTVERP